MKKTENRKTQAKESKNQASGTDCKDVTCPFHGELRARGRFFQGVVIRKLPRRIAIEFERMIYVKKYERYMRSKTKIHARLPDCLVNEIQVGDYIQVQECRPLSKIIHFVVVKKIKSKEEMK